ncbi:hypothetical protein SESBI_03426 [Sesbania bispinosa]|nr:hypothetical protein SESBI_03426 [Sesbania bispinosa]
MSVQPIRVIPNRCGRESDRVVRKPPHRTETSRIYICVGLTVELDLTDEGPISRPEDL